MMPATTISICRVDSLAKEDWRGMFASQAVLYADLESTTSPLSVFIVLVSISSVKQWLKTWRSITHSGSKQSTQQSFKTYLHKDNL